MKKLFFALAIFCSLINIGNSQNSKSQLSNVRHPDSSNVISRDSNGKFRLVSVKKAAMDAQNLKPLYKPKAWYEYLNTRTWVMLGIAGVLVLGWIGRNFLRK